MFTFESRVRYSEVAGDGRMSLGALINYFQDCSTFQSEALGVGLEVLKEKKRAWFLSSWQIEIDRYPELLEPIQIGTAAWNFKGLYGYRNFAMMEPDGKMFVRANSIWIYMDTVSGRPTKPLLEDVEVYGTEPPVSMEYLDRKIPVFGEGRRMLSFYIGRHQIDTNGHVNNSQYVQMAAEYLEENVRPYKLRVEYKKAAKFGEKVIPILYENEQEMLVALCDEEEKPYAVVAFSDMKETI